MAVLRAAAQHMQRNKRAHLEHVEQGHVNEEAASIRRITHHPIASRACAGGGEACQGGDRLQCHRPASACRASGLPAQPAQAGTPSDPAGANHSCCCLTGSSIHHPLTLKIHYSRDDAEQRGLQDLHRRHGEGLGGKPGGGAVHALPRLSAQQQALAVPGDGGGVGRGEAAQSMGGTAVGLSVKPAGARCSIRGSEAAVGVECMPRAAVGSRAAGQHAYGALSVRHACT